jgi:hypothetical protein
MAAKKRKAGDKKSGAKATSARRAVNIKVNVVSKNPRKKSARAKPVSRRARAKPVSRRAPARRTAKRITRKRAARFVICARTRAGKRFYAAVGMPRKLIADRKRAKEFPSLAAAYKEAHGMLSRMPATVKTLAVERA